MDQFRTTFHLPSSPFSLDLQTPVLSLGSCFANTMGKRLQQNKFRALVNPFGVIFNPLSIYKLLTTSIVQSSLQDQDLIQSQGIWYHYHMHSEFCADEPIVLKDKIQQQVQHTHHFLQSTQVLMLTFGTAYGYFRLDNQQLVANCHKVPQRNFEKRLLGIEEITRGFSELYQALQSINPQLKIVLTVSPVRHIKDTIPANQVSKSILRVACHQITEQLEDVVYFPAYELLLDDLRDYRFFKADMIHPNQVAEDYIWEKFTKAFMMDDTLQFLTQWKKIQQSLSHRSFHPTSEAHQAFLHKLLGQLEGLSKHIDVAEEIQQVKTQLV
ncbi:hypothetical protein BKI52_18735 [marine bacterium AO1-C]|nr:hypothetical protein BKI52_18735 [marine bacterium AO1-C]